MSTDITASADTVPGETPPQKTTADFKRSAFRVGMFTLIVFILRYTAILLMKTVIPLLDGSVSPSALYIIKLSISGVFVQILPSVIGAFIFRRLGKDGKGIKCLYTVPKNCSRAIGNFPAVYGIGQIVNILTMLVMFIIEIAFDLTRQLNTVVDEATGGIPEALFMFFMLVVVAPVFEEFIFRGLLMDELKPYGNGFAIITTGIMFGLYHGNFQQCFYTAALGVATGYIANVTGSIFPTMIIHMMVNGLGGIMVLLMSTNGVQEFILRGSERSIPDSDMIWVAIYGIFMVSVIILIIVGIISAILKLKNIKRYKVKKVCPEISNGKKTVLLLFSVPSLISLLMIFDTFTGVFSSMIYSALGMT